LNCADQVSKSNRSSQLTAGQLSRQGVKEKGVGSDGDQDWLKWGNIAAAAAAAVEVRQKSNDRGTIKVQFDCLFSIRILKKRDNSLSFDQDETG
jgi:hypothetical protein